MGLIILAWIYGEEPIGDGTGPNKVFFDFPFSALRAFIVKLSIVCWGSLVECLRAGMAAGIVRFANELTSAGRPQNLWRQTGIRPAETVSMANEFHLFDMTNGPVKADIYRIHPLTQPATGRRTTRNSPIRLCGISVANNVSEMRSMIESALNPTAKRGP